MWKSSGKLNNNLFKTLWNFCVFIVHPLWIRALNKDDYFRNWSLDPYGFLICKKRLRKESYFINISLLLIQRESIISRNSCLVIPNLVYAFLKSHVYTYLSWWTTHISIGSLSVFCLNNSILLALPLFGIMLHFPNLCAAHLSMALNSPHKNFKLNSGLFGHAKRDTSNNPRDSEVL